MRLEKAVVKGAIVISPYGFETEHIETVTKQVSGVCDSVRSQFNSLTVL